MMQAVKENEELMGPCFVRKHTQRIQADSDVAGLLSYLCGKGGEVDEESQRLYGPAATPKNMPCPQNVPHALCTPERVTHGMRSSYSVPL